jgi:hypothetical protein
MGKESNRWRTSTGRDEEDSHLAMRRGCERERGNGDSGRGMGARRQWLSAATERAAEGRDDDGRPPPPVAHQMPPAGPPVEEGEGHSSRCRGMGFDVGPCGWQTVAGGGKSHSRAAAIYQSAAGGT